MNEEFKVQMTPKDDSPANSQSLPAPINLKEDIRVELDMLYKNGITTSLPFSTYASPIFAQKARKGKLRLLVDLRKSNNLISDDYINNNHPFSTVTDAAQHIAGRKLFCKLHYSQAHHYLHMADQPSIEQYSNASRRPALNSQCPYATSVQRKLTSSSPHDVKTQKLFINLSKKNLNPHVEKDFTALFEISERLPQLGPEAVRTPDAILQEDQ